MIGWVFVVEIVWSEAKAQNEHQEMTGDPFDFSTHNAQDQQNTADYEAHECIGNHANPHENDGKE